MSKITIKQAVELAKITQTFTRSLKAYTKKHNLPYKETIIQVVASIIEVEELTENAD